MSYLDHARQALRRPPAAPPPAPEALASFRPYAIDLQTGRVRLLRPDEVAYLLRSIETKHE